MAKLALSGGSKTLDQPWHQWPVYTEEDEKALLEVLHSGNWGGYPSPNEKASTFARSFADAHDAKHGICASNGTVTLEIALRAAGIEFGDEVIVPPLTWIATAGAAVTTNAVPVFADIDPDTYCLDPNQVEYLITDRTRAIIPVHLGCSIANLDALTQISEKHDLVLIEDCAHMHGAKWKNKGVGSYGHLGSFSFQSSKLMTAGEGGIILTSDDILHQRCQSLVNCGRKEQGYDKFEGNVFSGNYRLTEWQAAILSVRLKYLESERAIREQNADYLTSLLEGIDGIRPLRTDARVTHRSCYQYVFRYEEDSFPGLSRDRFVKALTAEGIPCEGDFYEPVYKSSLFAVNAKSYPAIKDRYGAEIGPDSANCPVAEKAAYYESIWLHHPLFMAGKAEMEKIAEAIIKIKDNFKQLL